MIIFPIPCEYRAPVGSLFVCLHTKKQTPDGTVRPATCAACTCRCVPCPYPRPLPTEEELAKHVEEAEARRRAGQPLPPAKALVARETPCSHRGQIVRTIKGKGCANCHPVEVYRCALHGECVDLIQHVALPQAVCAACDDYQGASPPLTEPPRVIRDLRSQAYRRANPDVPAGGLPKPIPPLPWSPPKGIPQVGFLIPNLCLGGVGRVIVDTATHVQRVQIRRLAVKSLGSAFPPFLAELERIGCETLSGQWKADAQRVIDHSNVVVIWGFGTADAYDFLKFRGQPVLTQSHNTPNNDWTIKELSTALATGQVTHYQSCSRAAVASYPPAIQPQARIIVNGCDPGRLSPQRSREAMRIEWGLSKDQKVIGYFGRICAHKRMEQVAFAAHSLNATFGYGNQWQAVIAGHGIDLAACQSRCEGLPVRIVPALAHIADGFNAVDCFVNTSDYEGASMALIEAMLFGLPIVSTRTGSIPEMEEHAGRRLVYTVPHDCDPEHLAAMIQIAVEDRWQVDFAKAYARQHLTAKVMAEQFETWLLEILGELPDRV